jgi:hypothetical protein
MMLSLDRRHVDLTGHPPGFGTRRQRHRVFAEDRLISV